MLDLIAWCGFVGAWLLVIGPLGQAVRDFQDEEFERDSFIHAAQQAERPPTISLWWLLLPPVYFVLRRRRESEYRERIATMMKPGQLEAFGHLRDVASAWFIVATGASLIAVKETWELREQYEWADWVFWALVGAMLLVCGLRVVLRVRRDQPSGS